MTDALPRGVWFESARNRYRIRKYRNNKAYYEYRTTLEAALKVHAAMCEKVASIPRHKRGEKKSAPVPKSTFAGLAKVVVETT